MSDITMFYVPCSNKQEALKIAHSLVEQRLVACANIHESCTSVYEWKGEIREEQEAILILKTVKSLQLEVERAITDIHSYECPGIVALDTAEVNFPFKQWITEHTRSEC